MTTFPPPQTDSRLGHIIAVYGAHGGAGTTTVAVNLASGLMRPNVRVLLLDASIQFGDVSTFLNLPNHGSLSDVMDMVDDADYIDNVVSVHQSGLRVLLAPSRPEQSEAIAQQPEKVGMLLERLARMYDYIIVDMARHFDNLSIAILDRANFIVLVTTPTINAMKNTKLIHELFKTVGYSPQTILTVLNHYHETQPPRKYFLTADKIEKFLKVPLEARFPVDEDTAVEAIARGIAVMTLNRGTSPLGKALKDFADNIAKKQFPAARVPNLHSVKRSSIPSKPPQITVFIASATVEFVENLRKLVAFEPDLQAVGTAYTGTETIESIKNLKPNVAIIDTNISSPDFFDIGKEIIKTTLTTAIIVASVNNDVETIRRAMLSGARDFLVKPIDAELLYEKIRKVDAQFRMMRSQDNDEKPPQRRIFRDTII